MTPSTMYRRTVIRGLVEEFQNKGLPKAILDGWEEHYSSMASCINSINQTINRMNVNHIVCQQEGKYVMFVNTIAHAKKEG